MDITLHAVAAGDKYTCARMILSSTARTATIVASIIIILLIFAWHHATTHSTALAGPDASVSQNSTAGANVNVSRDSALDNALSVSKAYTTSYCINSTMHDIAIAYDWQPAERATEEFSRGVPKQPGQNYSRGLAMARLSSEDVSWIDDEGLDVQKYVHVVDDPDAAMRTPENKGNEVMAYLTYIIDYYDDLPDINLFMHSHRFAPHNDPMLDNDAVEIIQRLSSEHVIREGYVNLNCRTYGPCHHNLQLSRDPWEDSLLDLYGRLFPDRPSPWELSQHCCAQFAVSRERILATSHSQWVSYREWLLQTRLDNHDSGRVWEYLWHVIFTGREIHCPYEFECYCETYGICFQGSSELGLYQSMGLRAIEIEGQTEALSNSDDSVDLQVMNKTLQAEREELLSKSSMMHAAAKKRGNDSRANVEAVVR